MDFFRNYKSLNGFPYYSYVELLSSLVGCSSEWQYHHDKETKESVHS
jgi:hypothetical protein